MGCFNGKDAVEELYSPGDSKPSQSSSTASSMPGSTEGSISSDRKSSAKRRRASEKDGAAESQGRKSMGRTTGRISTGQLPGSPTPSDSTGNKRHSTHDSPHSMTVSSDTVAPFSTVEVSWKIRGVKCSEADWIGMYTGDQEPEDINDCVSTMMSTGKAHGTVKFTAPNAPGKHHFRYFLLDDSFVVGSGVVMVSKLDKAEVQADIFIRDAVNAELEVARMTGEEEGEDLPKEQGTPAEKKAPKAEKKVYTDMTGFESSKNEISSAEPEKVDPVSRWKKAAAAATGMEEAATSYFKVALTKKALRAQDKSKMAGVAPKPTGVPEEGTVGAQQTESSAESPAPAKKAGWGAAKAGLAKGLFQQGRANKAEDPNSIKARKDKAKASKPVMEEFGAFQLNRGKK